MSNARGETLHKTLGLWTLTIMSVGTILGAGVYALLGEAAGFGGNALWLTFVLAAVVALFTGLSYAEFSSRFPYAGAEFLYVKESFGLLCGWLTGWMIIASCIIAAATVSLGFANYFSALFSTPIVPIAIAVLFLIGIILVWGIKETAYFAILLTLVEALGLIIIIAIGLPHFGSVNYFELAAGMKGLIKGGVLIFFSYMGFENITRLSPETVDAKNTVPKAVILSILITVAIYILVGIAAVSAVPWDELAASDAPLAMIAERAFGEESFILLSLIALFSTFNTIIGMLLGASRIVFGMAQERALPQFFNVTSKKLKTPWVATMVIIGCAMCFSFFRNLETVANLANFAVFTVFILVNSSLIYLRYTKPVEEGFKVPFCIGKMPVIPLLGVVTTIFMIFNLTLDVFFMGIILIVLGLLLFGVLHKFGKKNMRLTGSINSFKLPFEK